MRYFATTPVTFLLDISTRGTIDAKTIRGQPWHSTDGGQQMKRVNLFLRSVFSSTKLIVLLCAPAFLIGALPDCQAADAPALRANYSAFSGAFAPVWIAADKGLFAKYGLNVDIRYIAPATSTQALLAKNLDIINPGGGIVEAGLEGGAGGCIAGILHRAVLCPSRQ